MDPFTSDYGEFQGIPKRALPDDTIQYFIYILDDTQSTAQLHARLETVIDVANQIVNDWGKEYIWQRESFGLEITEAEGRQPFQGCKFGADHE